MQNFPKLIQFIFSEITYLSRATLPSTTEKFHRSIDSSMSGQYTFRLQVNKYFVVPQIKCVMNY